MVIKYQLFAQDLLLSLISM